ncbi:MAG: isoprenylcysteine carboxylmethyltransferase family protein [Dehalococcoidia bacterium]
MKRSEPDNAGVIAPPPVIYLPPLAAGLVLHFTFPLPFLPLGWVQLAIGPPIIGIAGLLALSSVWAMEKMGTAVSPNEPTTDIVTQGPFRFCRNPMYLALTIVYVGIALSVNALWVLVLVPVALVVISLGVIKREERYLERKFGEEYLGYKARVRRWL